MLHLHLWQLARLHPPCLVGVRSHLLCGIQRSRQVLHLHCLSLLLSRQWLKLGQHRRCSVVVHSLLPPCQHRRFSTRAHKPPPSHPTSLLPHHLCSTRADHLWQQLLRHHSSTAPLLRRLRCSTTRLPLRKVLQQLHRRCSTRVHLARPRRRHSSTAAAVSAAQLKPLQM